MARALRRMMRPLRETSGNPGRKESMNREEWNELAECVVCGEAVSVSRDRGFPLNDQDCLCFACATERGGVYDEGTDLWTTAPNSATSGTSADA
jgi:hypothetical protein